MKRITIYFSQLPKRLFVVDGLGAMLSAFLLGVILVRFETFFGIPRSVLHFLATVPVLFAAFDLYAYLSHDNQHNHRLKVIALLNILYCVVSISAALLHYPMITRWGCTYVIAEVLIVATLARLEWRIANKEMME